MKLNVPYRVVCDYDTNLIEQIKNTLTEEDWYKNTVRNTMHSLEQTQSIILRYFDDYKNASGDWKNHLKNYPLYEKYKDIIEQSLNTLKQEIEFKEYMCFFARLRPNGVVGTHPDTGGFLETCHRIHIPIITNPDVKYVIEDREYYWEPGKVYEFDNTRLHGVINRSNQWRVHLMFNLYV